MSQFTDQIMKQVIRVLTVASFIGALATIAILAYEGMVQERFENVLIIAVCIMDYTFLISTVLHLFYYKRNKIIIGLSVFSLCMIAAAYGLKFTIGNYPVFGVLFWNFYIMIYYGILVLRRQWNEGGKEYGV